MIVPGYLVDYASGGGPSVSLPESVWQRLVTGRLAAKIEPDGETSSLTVLSSLVPAQALTPADAVKVVRALRLALRVHAPGTHKTSRAAAASAVEKVIESYGPATHTAQLILKWVHTRLVQLPRDGGLVPESVARYLTPIAIHLLAFAGADDWTQFEGEDVAELYLGIIASQKTDAEKAMAGRALANFHDVIILLFPSLRIDLSEIRPASVASRVNANIVSGPEYLHAKRKLARHSMTWRKRIPGIVLILGYRAGLRRNEALRLPLSCLRLNAECIELTVRKTIFGGLKSAAGTRRLPLSELLDTKETIFLRKWLSDRPVALENSKEQLLFCDGSNPTVLLTETEVFAPIRTALIAATGDRNICFHNLRHSFATFLLLTLIGLPEGSLRWLHGLDVDIVSGLRRDRMSLALLGERRNGRAALHAVSQACGHSDVRVTLASYMHLADLALWSLLSREEVQPRFSTAGKAALAGISQSAVRVQEHRWRRSKGVPRSADPAHRVDKATPTLAAHRDTSPKPLLTNGIRIRRSTRLVKMKSTVVTEIPPLNFIHKALEALHACVTPQDCAQSLGLTVDDISRWSQRARDLGCMQTQKGGFRHRSVGNSATDDMLFPSFAIGKREQHQAAGFWARVSAEANGIEPHADALFLFSRRYQSTGSRVRIDNIEEYKAYEALLTSLGVAKARVVWTAMPEKARLKIRRTQAEPPANKRGYFTVNSAGEGTASAGFNFAARMLIIAGKFSFTEGQDSLPEQYGGGEGDDG